MSEPPLKKQKSSEAIASMSLATTVQSRFLPLAGQIVIDYLVGDKDYWQTVHFDLVVDEIRIDDLMFAQWSTRKIFDYHFHYEDFLKGLVDHL